MILRRFSQHLKEQDWFAVGLDFLVVVAGVGVALLGQQWINDGQKRSDYSRAVEDLTSDLWIAYYANKERVALAGCRKARYLELGALLMETDTPWPGALREYNTDIKTSVLPVVIRSPFRQWTSRIWDAELESGTFSRMDTYDRQVLTAFFSVGAQNAALQANIRNMEAKLQALAFPLDLTLADRLRYYDVLAEADTANTLLERMAEGNFELLESSSTLRLEKAEHVAEVREFLDSSNAEMRSIYGECAVPVVFPALGTEPDHGK